MVLLVFVVLIFAGLAAVYYFRPTTAKQGLRYRSINPRINHKPEFSVATYNTLAVLYARYQKNTPPAYLDFSYRQPLLQRALANFGTDFICLQEVDRYDEFFDHALKSLGYQSAFVKRFGLKADGSLIAWREASWSPLEVKRIEYNRHLMAKSNPAYMRDNVAILGAFQHKLTHREVLVASTHMFWDPKFEYVKYAQTQMLLQEIEGLKSRFPNASVIAAGDFNSMPESNVFAYMRGQPPKEQNCNCFPELLKLWTKGLPAFYSAYADYDNGRHPAFTNYSFDFSGTLDYIFHSDDLTVLRVAEVLTAEEASREGCLPNSQEPSDHIPLIAVFH